MAYTDSKGKQFQTNHRKSEDWRWWEDYISENYARNEESCPLLIRFAD